MRKTAFILLAIPFILSASGHKRGLTTTFDIEFLYMKRANDAPSDCISIVDDASAIVESSNCERGNCKFTTRDVIHGQGYEPGIRATLCFLPSKRETWELRYTGLLAWESHKSAECQSTLEYPFRGANPTVDWIENERMEADVKAEYFDVECNYWVHVTPQRVAHFSVSGMIGARYFQFWETFNLQSHVMGDSSDYSIDAWNYMAGIQAGGMYESTLFPHFIWNLSVKIGGLLNHAEQKTFWGDDNNTEILADEKPHKNRAAFMGEIAINLIYEMTPQINIIGGYEGIYLNSIAQTTRQLQFDPDDLSPNKVNTKSHILIHGASLGFSFIF
jgi:hypothetical protein